MPRAWRKGAGMKVRVYKYVIDGVSDATLPALRRTVSFVPGSRYLGFDVLSGVLSLESAADEEASVKLACSAAGVRFRVKVT
jgi:hypothetical protein